MGLLSGLFAAKIDYPPIDPTTDAARRIAEVERQLGELAGKVSDKLEVIPSRHAAYVFIGKPPKKFGLAWIHNGEVSGLNSLVQDHGMKPSEVEKVVDELRSVYEKAGDAKRFSTKVNDRLVVVTPSSQLEEGVHKIIDRITH
ncbi:MAG: hypothetical protein KDI18_11365 [Gammaproteobacteria bacterium]|nr:hypothetical protein [Gammaproteobacteria bacterium]